MKTEIINIGDELLNGTSVNTNSTWLCSRVVENGGQVVASTMIGDDESQIVNSLALASTRADFVVVTGGLGPTSDDRTKDATLKYFGGNLIPDNAEIGRIRTLFAERGLPLTERNILQGWVPDNAIVFSNPVGTAPGMEFERDGVRFLFLPGVPAEMKRIFDDNIGHWFSAEMTDGQFISDEIMIIGVSESFVADKLQLWQEKLPAELSVAYLPSAGLVKVRLSVYHHDKVRTMSTIQESLLKAAELFPGEAFYTGGRNWENYFFQNLLAGKKTIATAESCTGGYLSHLITTIPGSSEIFRGGIVAYHNNIKTEWLGVDESTINAYGAVSNEVTTAMAASVREKFNADIGVAVSGIAGPGGGTDEKPVGTVWIAVSHGKEVIAQKFLMGSDRIRNIEKSAVMAMKMVLNSINSLTSNSAK